MNRLDCQAWAYRGARWLGLALLLLLPLSLAWAASTAGSPAPTWPVGLASLPSGTNICNLIGGSFPGTTATGIQGWPRIAYNSPENKFLVVWQSQAVPTANWNVCGKVLDINGTVSPGQGFCIDRPANQQVPTVAYNSAHNEFLVVWQDNNTPNGSWDIYGQFVTASGVLTGTVFPIVTRPDYPGYPTQQQNPAVSYNQADDEYLVVWQDDYRATFPYITPDDIYGVCLYSTGERRSSFTPISIAPDYQQHPAVVYDGDTHQYLVVWDDPRQGDQDIYGQRIASDCTLVGDTCALVKVPGNQCSPNLTYNSRVYLLTWQDHRGSDWDIYAGQMTSSDLANCKSKTFYVSAKPGDQQLPAVVYSLQKEEYLIVWQDKSSDTEDIYGQRVAADGTLLGNECPIAVANSIQTAPAMGYNSQADEYLVVWQDNRAGQGNDDIYGQRVAPGPPLMAAALAQPTSGCMPLQVCFTGTVSGGTGPYSYRWVFGDGGTSNEPNPCHTYNNSGTYTATLTVTDVHDCSDTKAVTITIYANPTAGASATPSVGFVPLQVCFTGTVSGGTGPYSYRWVFGDSGTSNEPNPCHTYNSAGTYTADLTVTDVHDCSDTKTVTITVSVKLYLPVIMKNYMPPTATPTNTPTNTPTATPPTCNICNGGLETGDFTCWVHDGSSPQSVVKWLSNGDPPYQGQFCARLGKLVPCSDQDAAVAWMYQELIVPNVPGTVTITFTYRIFTNDVIDWAYFQVELRDLNDALLSVILKDGSDSETCDNLMEWKTFSYNKLDYLKGQTVRLRFESHNKDGGYGIWTYVDAVSLNCSQ
jgi:PKD repeat protein